MIDEQLKKLLKSKPEASEYLLLFAQYCDLLDDQIDEEKNDERTRRISELAAKIFNCSYWQTYSKNLYLLERTINNCYFDSLRWKCPYGQLLASCGIQMIVAVLIIEFGEEVANEWSLKIREIYYNKHKNDAML